MLETEVVEDADGDNCCAFEGGSGARRSGSVVGRFAFISFEVDDVTSELSDDDDDEELIDVFSNFSLNSLIR